MKSCFCRNSFPSVSSVNVIGEKAEALDKSVHKTNARAAQAQIWPHLFATITFDRRVWIGLHAILGWFLV